MSSLITKNVIFLLRDVRFHSKKRYTVYKFWKYQLLQCVEPGKQQQLMEIVFNQGTIYVLSAVGVYVWWFRRTNCFVDTVSKGILKLVNGSASLLFTVYLDHDISCFSFSDIDRSSQTHLTFLHVYTGATRIILSDIFAK